MRVFLGGLVLVGAAIAFACASGNDATSSKPGTGGSGAVGGTTSGGGGSTSGGGTGGLGSGGGTGGTATGGAAGGGGVAGSTGGAAGSGGSAGAGGGNTWPTCDAQPGGVPLKSINDVWNDNPSTETQVWVPGAYVTAISGNGCVDNQTCQVFLQQDLSYASLAAGAKHAIKMRISASVAKYFTGIAVGDRVDALGWAWRYNLNGENELVLQSNATLPGCLKKVGTGTAIPVTVQYSDLTVNAYEQTTGPLLVQLAGVTGKPALPGEIFGLWLTGVGIGDAGPEGLVNLSPYFLANSSFTGLTQGVNTDFSSVTGVFALFVPVVEAGTPIKYVVVYPRTMSEVAP
jgi:hypothetical protein